MEPIIIIPILIFIFTGLLGVIFSTRRDKKRKFERYLFQEEKRKRIMREMSEKLKSDERKK
jgi:hypothetical protein